MNTKILPDAVLNRIKSNRTVYQLARGARSRVGAALGARSVPGIPYRVHFNDFMLDSTDAASVDRYMGAGREAVRHLDESLAAAGKSWQELGSVLEFGSGYGRLTRILVDKIDPSKLTVCDVIDEGARFCAEEFKVRRVPSTADVDRFQAEPSDFVFFVSVQTHLSPKRLEQLQSKLRTLLNPGGVVHFTTMGPTSANNTARYGDRWRMQQPEILEELARNGISFHPYGYYKDPDYGMTWETYEHATDMMHRLHGDSMRLLKYSPGADDGHQDVYVYQRVA